MGHTLPIQFGPGEGQFPDEIEISRFDSILLSVLNFKYGVRDGLRAAMAYQLAEKRDISPADVSQELYNENVIPERAEQSETEE